MQDQHPQQQQPHHQGSGTTTTTHPKRSYNSPPRIPPSASATTTNDNQTTTRPKSFRFITEETYFEQEQIEHKDTHEKAIHPIILSRLQENIMDSFVFKFSSVVCSLEYNQLVDCFQQGEDQEQQVLSSSSSLSGTTTSLAPLVGSEKTRSSLESTAALSLEEDQEEVKSSEKSTCSKREKWCAKQSKQYGDCVYSRFNQVVGLLCVHEWKCKQEYDWYETCLKLMSTNGHADQSLKSFFSSYKWNQVQGTKHSLPYVNVCETYLWRRLYKCLTNHLRIDPAPFNQE